MAKFKCITSPVLIKSIGNIRTFLGTQRNLFREIEGFVKELPMATAVFNPMFEAVKQGSRFKATMSTRLEKIARGMDTW